MRPRQKVVSVTNTKRTIQVFMWNSCLETVSGTGPKIIQLQNHRSDYLTKISDQKQTHLTCMSFFVVSAMFEIFIAVLISVLGRAGTLHSELHST